MWRLVDSSSFQVTAAPVTRDPDPAPSWEDLVRSGLAEQWSWQAVPVAEPPAGTGPAARTIARALSPVLVHHEVTVDAQMLGDAIVWCSDGSELPVRGVPIPEPGFDCVDVWAHLDAPGRRIALSVDHQDLAERRAGGNSHPVEFDLDGDLERSLAKLTPWLDELCDAILGS